MTPLTQMNNIEKILDEIKLIQREDWMNHQICGDMPNVDTRCLVFCCSPAKPCPLRNIVLRKMGLTVEYYAKMKEKSSKEFEI